MLEYKPTPLLTLPKRELKQTAENRFWNKYQKIYEKQCDTAVSVITACNTKNLTLFAHNFNIEVFSGKTKQTQFTIAKYCPEITGACFRKDGIFAALGESSGKLKILDIPRKQYTRDHTKHKRELHGLAFASEGTILGSSGDDRNVIFYDYAMNEIVRVFENYHKDNIRTLRAFPNDGNLFMTGSHDFMMKMIDLRESTGGSGQNGTGEMSLETQNESLARNCLDFNHGCEVEDLEILPEGNLFVSVGGNFTKLWDVRRNEKPVYEITANTKTVSSVRILESGKRVLTGSYDGFLKIFDPQDEMKIVHQKKMPAPIMGLAISHNMENLTVGYSTGQLDILHRNLDHIETPGDLKNEPEWDAFEKNLYKTLTFGALQQKDTRSRKFFARGVYATPGEFDTKVEQKNSKRLQKFDRLLRKFKYGEALSQALVTKNTIVILSVIEELLYRNGLKSALEKKGEEFYKNFLGFVLKKIDSANCQKLLIHVFEQFLGVFNFAGFESSAGIDELLNRIRAKVDKEVKVVKKTVELRAILEALDL